MGRNSVDRSYIQTLKNRLVLSDIIGPFVQLKKKGQEFWGCCPFHHEKTPSFKVNNERGAYHCFGCGARGDALTFLQEKSGLSFQEALEGLSRKAGMTLPEARQEPAAHASLFTTLKEADRFFQNTLHAPEGLAARHYLEKRGVSHEAIQRFGLGVTPSQPQAFLDTFRKKAIPDLITSGLANQKETRLAPHFHKRLMFPLRDTQGRPLGFGGRTLGGSRIKYINSPETPVFSKQTYLYGLYEARTHPPLKNKPVVFVEGYLDVIALQSHHIARAVAPLGTELSHHQLDMAWKSSPHIILCFDGDEAGRRASLKAAEKALSHITDTRTLSIAWLEEGEDPQSLIQKNQTQVLNAALEGSQPLCDALFDVLRARYDMHTPEGQAQLQKHYKTWTESISSPDLRAGYRRAFSQKFWDHVKGKRNAGPHNLRRPAINASKTRTLQEKIIIATLIHHPHLLIDHLEPFACIPFSPALAPLQQGLLTWACEPHHDVTTASLKQSLHQQTLTADLRRLEETPGLADAAPFSTPTSPKDQTEKGLLDLFAHFGKNKHLKEDISKAEACFAQNMHEGAWQRLRKLRDIYHKKPYVMQ